MEMRNKDILSINKTFIYLFQGSFRNENRLTIRMAIPNDRENENKNVPVLLHQSFGTCNFQLASLVWIGVR